MDLYDFDSHFTVGFGLSIEERAVLEDEMRKRAMEERLSSIKFWGRISGTTTDYLIVCGILSVLEQPHRKFYYATNKSLVLRQMPDLNEEFITRAKAVNGRFVGNPARLILREGEEGGDEEPAEEAGEAEGEDGQQKPKAARFSEAHRLAYVVSQIEHDCAVVPKGAFIATPTHQVVADPLFAGLSSTDAGHMEQYYHFRKAEHPSRASALTSAAVVGAGDFMDPISEDEPKGTVWALRVDAAHGQVSLRSFKWPGYFFFHNIGTSKFGGAYFGDGQLNRDLCFMA